MRFEKLVFVVASLLVTGVGAPAAMAAGMPDDFERAVLKEINRARTDPRAAADDLRRYRETFDGRVTREDGDPIGVLTIEGPRAIDDAIEFLDRQKPLPPLDRASVLTRAAHDWAVAQGPIGGLGHVSTTGVSPGARVRAAGGDVYVGETISYGMTRPEAVVRQLIVDDGQPRRGHRALVFSRDFRFAGVGCGGHARFGTMCVIDYAETPDGGPPLHRVAAIQPPRASAFNR